ncbi:MAG TPA: HAD family hydrolase [Capsulimonadaceae bacterium]|nr:HAD family hydrolase [Capsulimonadaceae bacterium]
MSNTTERTLQGVIFDLDGTLIDSNDADARAWADALNQFGYPLKLEEVRKLVGMGADNLLPRAIGIKADSDLGRRIDALRGTLLKEKYFGTIEPLPRARSLIARIHMEGLKLILASSGKEEEVDALIGKLGPHVDDMFDARASANAAQRSKPSPDIVLAALDKAGLCAPECVMLGDTPYDIIAGQAAGVPVIALRSGGWPDGDLQGAVAIYDDPADLLEHYEDSPLARREGELAHIAGQRIEERQGEKAGAHATPG